jgi:hypothetical protein
MMQADIEDIMDLPQLERLIFGLRRSRDEQVPLGVFETWPKARDARFLVNARVSPVSDLAMALLIRQNGIATAESVERVFTMFRPVSEATTTFGKDWEMALRRYFQHANGDLPMKRLPPRRVKAGRGAKRSHPPDQLEDEVLEFRNLSVHICKTDDEAKTCLQRHFENDTACYIRLMSKTFPTWDAMLFRPGKAVVLLRDTLGNDHKANYRGFEIALKWFDPPKDWYEYKKYSFRQYLPENLSWELVFVVDDSNNMEDVYDEAQEITCGRKMKTPEQQESIDKWTGLIEQFVLERKHAVVFEALAQEGGSLDKVLERLLPREAASEFSRIVSVVD